MAGKKNKKVKKRKTKGRLKKAFAILIFISLVVLATLSLTIFFPVANIKLAGKSIYTSEQIISASGIKENDNMFMPLFNGSKERIKSAMPYIKKVTYKYTLPDTVTIEVTPYIAAYQFKVKNDFVITAKDGTVLEILNKQRENTPTITVNALEYKVRKPIAFGDSARQEIFTKVTESLKDFGHTFTAMDLTDTVNISLTVNDNTVIELGSVAHLVKKMNMAKKMLKTIPQGESGTLNLTAWTPENKQASYVKNEQ